MTVLNKLLTKRGIDNIDDLTPEEKEVYERYQVVLSGETVSVENVKTFCKNQIAIIEEKFAEAESTHDTYYKACLHVYLNILKAIEAPEAERKSLEQHLTQLIT